MLNTASTAPQAPNISCQAASLHHGDPVQEVGALQVVQRSRWRCRAGSAGAGRSRPTRSARARCSTVSDGPGTMLTAKATRRPAAPVPRRPGRRRDVPSTAARSASAVAAHVTAGRHRLDREHGRGLSGYCPPGQPSKLGPQRAYCQPHQLTLLDPVVVAATEAVGLDGEHLRVAAAEGHQLVVRARLGDPALRRAARSGRPAGPWRAGAR